MKEFLQNNMRGIIVALLGVGLITAVVSASSNSSSEDVAQNDTGSSESTDAENSEEVNEDEEPAVSNDSTANDSENGEESSPIETVINKSGDDYEATYAAGDSQTSVARTIIDRHLSSIEAGGDFSAEQKLFMETWLVDQLGRNDIVHVGDSVSITKVQLETVTEAARKLDESQIAAWADYL